jgi:hypothetical protein
MCTNSLDGTHLAPKVIKYITINLGIQTSKKVHHIIVISAETKDDFDWQFGQ